MRRPEFAPGYVLYANRSEPDPMRREYRTTWTCVRLSEVPRLARDVGGKEIWIDRDFSEDFIRSAVAPRAAVEHHIMHGLTQLLREAVAKGCSRARLDEYVLAAHSDLLLMREIAATRVAAANAKAVKEEAKRKARAARYQAIIRSQRDRPRLP